MRITKFNQIVILNNLEKLIDCMNKSTYGLGRVSLIEKHSFNGCNK